ncbi:HoxN/HupN/NixA family nickel/cobalt transporter [Sphingomonas sp. PB4P5]|uniref:HoxN/HupN/NixA family nickel/cobalt transporter n=1 Tax=Parasphingomonas puruogangriensis TaxID=3096155 RepID=UPI002FCC3795
MRQRLLTIYAVLAIVNGGAWIWAFLAFAEKPLMMGVAVVAYGLGLRHAMDADHIAAIDNVTRKLMRDGRRPVSVGFFFALGHSSVVGLMTILVASLAVALGSFEQYGKVGGRLSAATSMVFFVFVVAMNLGILRALHADYRRVRAGRVAGHGSGDVLAHQGLLARLLRPAFRLITRSWHMFPLGALFGLGFETATEVTIFGVSAAQAANGLPLSAVLVLPALFAAGMMLMDTTDGVLMLGVYDWASQKPMRRIYYNMTITLVSVAVALLIGAVQLANLLRDRMDGDGAASHLAQLLEGNMNTLGIAVVVILLASWLLSWTVHRFRKPG